jgi:hypothetical protein
MTYRCDRCKKFATLLARAPKRHQPTQWGVINGEEIVYWCLPCIEVSA